MNLAAFEALLKRTMGLDASSIGSSAVERAVESRAAARKAENWQEYFDLASADRGELQELVEAVVIPETWFFRDREAFSALAVVAADAWRADGKRVLRFLSLPCATGEEPYSMAMALLDRGAPADLFTVDAVDISARSLALAEGATYGKNAFRGTDLRFRDRHFTRQPHGYRLSDEVRRQVRFAQGNLFDERFKAREPYDAVFCRNLLIYFDAPTQGEAILILAALLRPGGHFFVGPSEASLLLNLDFESAKIPLAFAFRKGRRVSVPAALAARRASARPVAAWARPALAPSPVAPSPAAASPVAASPTAEIGLADVQRLADEGHLAEAARHCEAFLRRNGTSVAAVFLLGVIRDAAGNLAEAVELYRKAVYLDPGHQPALEHLALVLERSGDASGAKAVKDRLHRLGLRGSA